MSLRAIIIGLALVIIQTAVTPYNDYYLQGTDISGSHFPLGALFALIVLTLGINPALKKIAPKAELKPSELMIVWVMLVVTSAIPSKGMMGYLLPYIWSPHAISTRQKTNGQIRSTLTFQSGLWYGINRQPQISTPARHSCHGCCGQSRFLLGQYLSSFCTLSQSVYRSFCESSGSNMNGSYSRLLPCPPRWFSVQSPTPYSAAFSRTERCG